MKTKTSKKVLSFILAVMMVVTSIPMLGFVALAEEAAAEDTYVTAAKDAMDAYETKMKGTVYTGMLDAYNAYVALCETLDAYQYGFGKDNGSTKAVTSADLTSATTALTTATNAMSAFTPYKGTAKGYHVKSEATNGYDNLLYCSYNNTWWSSSTTTVGNGIFKLAVPYQAVMLYDGSTTTGYPTVIESISKKSLFSYQTYIFDRANYTSGGNLNLKNDWYTSSSCTDYQTYYGLTSANAEYTVSSASNGNSNSDVKNSANWYWNNELVYTGTGDTTNYYESFGNISVGIVINDDKTGTTSVTGVNSYVINYKPIVDFVNDTTKSAYLSQVSQYKEGGLASLMSVYNTATTLDPNSYFKTYVDNNSSSVTNTQISDAVKALANDIKSFASASSSVSTTADSVYDNEYQNLRDALGVPGVRATYEGGNIGYTQDSWDAFTAAYENAAGLMSTLPANGYTRASDASSYATALNTAYAGLQTNVTKVDASALENEIDKFESYANVFTDATYNAVLTVVDAAKAAVWGSVENYKVEASALDDSADAQTTVAQQTANVQEAVKQLRFSMDAVVNTASEGRTSLNTALALKNEVDKNVDDNGNTIYGNLAVFTDAYLRAQEYATKAASAEFTDYDTQLAEYVAEIENVYTAYHSLVISFLKMPNGTVAQQGSTTTMTTLTTSDTNCKQQIGFSYTSGAIVFLTKRENINVKYGSADITFGTNRGKGTFTDVPNNMLDSISINATAAAINGQDGKNHISGTSASNSSTPKALTDTQYAGCLSYKGISIQNLKYAGRSSNNNAPQAITTSDGTTVSFDNAKDYDVTSILGTTDGASSQPGKGGIFARTNDDQNTFAYAYVTGDMYASITASAKKTLSGTTTPTVSTVSLSGTNFGAVSIYNTQNTTAWSSYNYVTSASTGETINTVVSVVDINNLVDLVNMCNALLPDQSKYTEETWSNFTEKLNAAQADYDYSSKNAGEILTEVKSRYSNLWAAYSALEFKTFTVTFNWIKSTGVATSKEITVTYGDNLGMSKYVTQINSINLPTDGYVKDNYTYKPTGSWIPELDLESPIYADATYVADYVGTPNEATWDAFNTAKSALVSAIVDYTYSATDLETLNTEISALSYFNYTTEQQATVMADMQTEIDAQADKMVELKKGLTPSTVDTSVADSIGGDQDRYSATVDVYKTVTVADKSVIGFAYETTEELDAALRAALTVRSYKIYLNGATEPIATVDYGTPVIVNSDGTCQVNVDDTHPDYSGASVSWFYSYSAPSTNGTQTARKYMTAAPSLGFIVKGDTYLTTTDENSTEVEGVVVKLVANLAGTSTKTYAVCYTDADGVLIDAPAAPSYPFYKFVGYTCDTATLETMEDGSLRVDDYCTITANYEVDSTYSNGFAINVYMGDDPSFVLNSDDGIGYDCESSDGKMIKAVYDYNEKVEFLTEGFWLNDIGMTDVYGIFTAEDPTDYDTYQLLTLGGDYEFYAYSDMNIIACSQDVIDSFFSYNYKAQPTVIANDSAVPIYNSSAALEKISLVGTFALPEGYTLVESGFLFSSNTSADLTVENVGTDGVARMKSSKYTVGNQFVINVKTPSDGSDVSFKYAAYAIVKDSAGNQSIFYSTSYDDTTANY
ncbi:MAG: hypothetical protein PUE08_08290 [Eubacteriales bacterium]|nr:hypothetical protein [Eubacteriales bacterium]